MKVRKVVIYLNPLHPLEIEKDILKINIGYVDVYGSNYKLRDEHVPSIWVFDESTGRMLLDIQLSPDAVKEFINQTIKNFKATEGVIDED